MSEPMTAFEEQYPVQAQRIVELEAGIKKLKDYLHGHDEDECPICLIEDENERMKAVVEAARRVKKTAIKDQDCWFMGTQAASDLEEALAAFDKESSNG